METNPVSETASASFYPLTCSANSVASTQSNRKRILSVQVLPTLHLKISHSATTFYIQKPTDAFSILFL